MKQIAKIALGVVLGFVLLIGGCSLLFTAGSNNDQSSTKQERQTKEESTIEDKNNEDVPFEHRQALNTAKDYIDYVGGFSKKGLKEQLDYEGYSSDAIDYAIKTLKVDYKEQCAISAENYLKNVGGFSESGLREQLSYEGFTQKQINYAMDKVYK